MSLFGPTVNYGKIAGRNEKKRQALLDLGTEQINALYGGGKANFYTLAGGEGEKFNKGGTYYSLTGKGITPYWQPGVTHPSGTESDPGILGRHAMSLTGNPMGVFGNIGIGKLFTDTKSPRAIAREQFNKGLLFNAPEEKSFEGFQPEFYDARSKAYTDYALPQLGEQYRSNRDAILYGLSNRGLLQSSVASKARSGLERTVGQGKQAIADEGRSQAQDLRRSVENSRQQSIAQLYQTADPGQAFQSATNAAAEFRQPSTFAPISDMFANLAKQYYVNRLLNSYQQPYSLNPANSGLSLSGALGPETY